METFCILKVIWSIDIWDDVHIFVRVLNWLSVEPLTGRVAVNVTALIYPPPFPSPGLCVLTQSNMFRSLAFDKLFACLIFSFLSKSFQFSVSTLLIKLLF